MSSIGCPTVVTIYSKFNNMFYDFKDFPLPPECANFCQPDGCKVIQMKKGRNKEVTSFVFTLTDKDSGNDTYKN